jgi:hypothetical protein
MGLPGDKLKCGPPQSRNAPLRPFMPHVEGIDEAWRRFTESAYMRRSRGAPITCEPAGGARPAAADQGWLCAALPRRSGEEIGRRGPRRDIGCARCTHTVASVLNLQMKPVCNARRDSEMPDFDVEAFVTELDRMGVKLTAIPLADGKLRVNRWCMLAATEYAQQIENLWITQIGNASERIDVLAAHLIRTAPLQAGDHISSSPMRFDSPPLAEPNGAECRGGPVAADPFANCKKRRIRKPQHLRGARPTSSNNSRCRATCDSRVIEPKRLPPAWLRNRDRSDDSGPRERDELVRNSPMSRSLIHTVGLRLRTAMQPFCGSVSAATKRSSFMRPAASLMTRISKAFKYLYLLE